MLVSIFFRIASGGKISALNSRYLCSFFFLLSFLFSLLVYFNLRYLRNLLPGRIYFTVIGLGISFGIISLLSLSLIPRKSKAIFAVFTLFSFLVIFSFLYFPKLRYKTEPQNQLITSVQSPARRVILLYMEGLSLDDILKFSEKRELPNFSYLMEKGAWGKVLSPKPCSSPTTFFSFLRGKLPKNTGYSSYRVFSIRGKGKFTLLPRWAFFQALTNIGVLKVKAEIKKPNCGVVDLVRRSGGRADIIEAGKYRLRRELLDSFFPKVQEGSWQYSTLLQSLSKDFDVSDRALKMVGKYNMLVAKFEGMKEVKLRFLKYSSGYYPFVDPGELERYMEIIERYYQIYDQIIGRFLTLFSSDDLLIIVSPFSVEVLPLWRSYVEVIFGDKLTCGDYFDCPDGLFFAFSKNVSLKNSSLSLLDIAPTVSYFLGLPVEKESDGRVASEIFERKFSIENPIFFIHSYSSFLKEEIK